VASPSVPSTFGGRAKHLRPWIGIVPGLAVFLVFALLPALAVFPLSLTDISGIKNAPWRWIGFDNYGQFFSGGQLSEDLAALERSIIFCVSVTVIQTALALGIALLLNGKLRGRSIWRTMVFLPTVLGVTVIGLTWSLFFNPTGGPGESILKAFGGTSAFFGDIHVAFPLVIFVQIWASTGFAMIIFLAGLQAVPEELVEAAKVDGANRWSRFWNVTYRLIAPAMTANVLLAIIGSLQSYQYIYVLTSGEYNTSVLAYYVFESTFGGSATGGGGSGIQQQGYASAVSMVQFGIIVVIALSALWYLRRREVDL
jgi:raffinose/stachyose/melibiose transport system permease protein